MAASVVSKSVDVAIVGGGVVGLSVAAALGGRFCLLVRHADVFE